MAFKPFKWIKKHPVESALLLAAIGTGFGAAGMGPMAGLFGEAGAGAAGAAGAEAATGGTSALLGAGTLPSQFANMLAGGMGPSDFTAAMAGDAYMPGAMGASGTGTPSMGSKIGSMLASGNGMNPKNAMLLAQMTGAGQQQERPMGSPVDMGNPMQRQAMATQEQITKKWLMENDPNTYARIYGAPQPMGG